MASSRNPKKPALFRAHSQTTPRYILYFPACPHSLRLIDFKGVSSGEIEGSQEQDASVLCKGGDFDWFELKKYLLRMCPIARRSLVWIRAMPSPLQVHNWPSTTWALRAQVSWVFPVSPHTSDSCGRLGACKTDVLSLDLVQSSDVMGLVGFTVDLQCERKQAAWQHTFRRTLECACPHLSRITAGVAGGNRVLKTFRYSKLGRKWG